jgi:branched-chain amino acid transport system ATP-binding protein
MAVVVDISDRVLVLDFGRKIAEGEPEAVMGDPGVRKAYLGADADAEPPQGGAPAAEAPRPAAAQ